MNINEQLGQLGQLGARDYKPSDDLVSQLVRRTGRARAVHQGAMAVVGSVGAVSLGVAGAHFFFGNDEDPGLRDRNLIEDRNRLYFNFEEKNGTTYRGYDEKSKAEYDAVLADLKAAAKAEEERAAKEREKAKNEQEEEAEEKPEAEACENYDYGPDKPWKYWDCDGGKDGKGAWKIKSGWYQDLKDSSQYWNCSTHGEKSYDEAYYNCSKGKWVTQTGWVEFSGIYAQCKSYYDKATDANFNAAYVKSDSWRKMVECDPSSNWAGKYRHVEDYASVSGTTCEGDSADKKGAPHRFSCNPKKWGDNGTDEWILKDPSMYKWFSKSGYEKRYYCIDEPPAGWFWNGSEWEEEPTP